MCVVAVAWRAHPRWRLIVAGNRDELHARASAPLARWNDGSDIIAGRDLVSGGGWMGVSDAGRFAVVTNIRNADGPDPQKASRGQLVSRWLADGVVPLAEHDYNPFNLVLTDRRSARLMTNRPGNHHRSLPPGVTGLSNAILDERWPRKDRLVAAVKAWLDDAADTPGALLDILSDSQLPRDDAYPLFIRNAVYGTRCSTVVAVDRDGIGQIIERRFGVDGAAHGETAIAFDWPFDSMEPTPALGS